MKLFNTTTRWVNWWTNRKISWKDHYMNPEHPHRSLIVQVLARLTWGCLFEVGCGAGANLVAILKAMPNKQVGGVDVNKDAIEFAQSQFKNGLFKVNSADDVMLSDKSVDVILSDMCMIYISPFKMGKHIREFKRLARNYVVLCELNSKSWIERFALKWREGYNMYDWISLLERHGFYDIRMYKLPKEAWPESSLQQKYAYIIVAHVPKEYEYI